MKEDQQIKERFFAQYWDQKVMYDSQRMGYIPYDFIEGLMATNAYALLSPLSAITDEHAIEVAKILNWTHLSPESQIHSVKVVLLEKLYRQTNISGSQWERVITFLRSKGYALPFGGKSVEQLIEMGILKLREV